MFERYLVVGKMFDGKNESFITLGTTGDYLQAKQIVQVHRNNKSFNTISIIDLSFGLYLKDLE